MMKKLPHFIKTTLFENGQAVLPVSGNSMYPLIHHNEKLTITPLDSSYLTPGFLYVYISNGILVVHRLLFFTKKFVYFLGDNSSSIEKVEQTTIIGRVGTSESKSTTSVISFLNFLFFPLQKTRLFKYRVKCIRYFYKRYVK